MDKIDYVKTLTVRPMQVRVIVSSEAMQKDEKGAIIGMHKKMVLKAISEALLANGAIFWSGLTPPNCDAYEFMFWVSAFSKAPGFNELEWM